MVEGVGGDCLYRCRRRLRKSWLIVFPLLVFTLLTSISHHVHLSSIVQNVFLGPALYICIGAVTPYLFYRQATDDMNMSSVREKRIYALQAALTWFMPIITHTIWLVLFLPLATKAQSDARRTKIAFIALIVGRPFIGIAIATARFINHGPPTRTAPLIFPSAVLYLSVPRLIQARMESVEAKVVNSLLFATFDFLTDLFLPYGDIIKTTLWRHIKDKCISAANTSVMTLKRKDSGQVSPSRAGSTSNIDKTRSPSILSRSVTSCAKESAAARGGRQKSTLQRALSSMSTMTTYTRRVFDLRLAYVCRDTTPRYLRALSDGLHGFNLSELSILVFFNVLMLTLEQILQPGYASLCERLATLAVLIVIEAILEWLLFIYAVRVANLPLLRMESEPGVRVLRVVTLLCSGILIFNSIAPFVFFFSVRALDERYQSVDEKQMCGHYAFVFRT
ncbi:unnamed protein product [Vitrella brassicaformis CCMP3155]|uniref:Uncharacterized protein n=1 Tax=Vitrella brassicaformis (strain CCMP3155) TaxID=1169540 RepID=A0A0G4ET64_VITBC|nr:unnamed protein product [Vitrella brassicaformis CCMP3155]|eukprot:CEM01044.1 unnamed protein product [Vitrella brassicaformis CCMP3155]